jgi:hypothetical protein
MILNEYYKAISLTICLSYCVCQKQTVIIKNVTISWENKGAKTIFNVSTPLGNGVDVSDCWLGVGITSAKGMVRLDKTWLIYKKIL